MAEPTSSDQLAAAKQLTEAIKSFASLTEKNNSLLRSQLELTRQISSYSKSIGDATASTTQSLNDAAENVDKLNNSSLEDLVSQLDDANDEAEKSRGIFSKLAGLVGKTIKIAAAMGSFAVEKFFSILKGVYSIGKTVVSTLFSIVGAFWEIGKALLSIPFKAFDWLIAKSQSMGGGGNEYAQAIQDIKKEYGDLNQVAPKTIMSMARNTQSLTDVGIKARRVFGNLGERMKAMLEFSQKLGPLFENFADEFEKTGLKIPSLAKGMGLADEQALTVAQRAKTLGIKLQDQYLNIHKMSWTLGKNYGHATKLLNRDVAIAMKDVKRFGGATEAQMMSAAVYARSLGLELDKISGILDAFDTFEGAADVASKLAQTWGVQIDPFALLNEQDPVSIIESIRQGFASSGKDITQFNRAEKDLLAQITKLSPEIAQQAFSLHNQGVALEDVMKDANTASKSFATLDGALEQLRGSIELIVQSGSMPQFEGFFDAWWKGIQRGIELNPQFRGLFRDIKNGLNFTFRDAQRVLDAFVEHFPGVKDMLLGLQEIFSPAKLGGLIRGINNELILFFRNLNEGKVTFSSLVTGITNQFENYLGGAEGGGSQFLNGLSAFGQTVAKIAGSIIEWIGSAIADGITWLTSFINNPSSYINPAVDAASSAASAVAEGANSLWTPVWEGLQNAWNQILPALVALGQEIGSQLPIFKEFLNLFNDSTIDDGTGGKKSNLRVMLEGFWGDLEETFHNITSSDFFKDFKSIFSELKDTISKLISAVIAVGAARGAMSMYSGLGGKSLAGGLLTGLAAGAIAGGVTAVATGAVDEEDLKSINDKLPDMLKVIGSGATPGTESVARDVEAAAAEASKNEDLKQITSEIKKSSTDLIQEIDNTLSFGGISNEELKKTFNEMKEFAVQIKDASITANEAPGLSTLIQVMQSSFNQIKSSLTDKQKSDIEIGKKQSALTGGVASPSPTVTPLPAAPTAPPKPVIPALDVLGSLTFDDVSKSISYLSESLEGDSKITKLVQSINKAGKLVEPKEVQDNAKNLSTFLGHVKDIAVALGGMQNLVSVDPAAGESNFDRVKKDLGKFSLFLEDIAKSYLPNIIWATAEIHRVLSTEGISTGVLDLIRSFFATLNDVGTALNLLSGVSIDYGRIGTNLTNIASGFDHIKDNIGGLVKSAGGLHESLNVLGDKERKTNATKITDFLKVFDPFVANLSKIRAGLAKISGLGAGAEKIDKASVAAGIGALTGGLTALSESSKGNAGLSGAVGGMVGDKGKDGTFSIKTEQADIPAKLSAIKGHLSQIETFVGDAQTPGTIISGLVSLASLVNTLKPNGAIGQKLAGADFSKFGELLGALDRISNRGVNSQIGLSAMTGVLNDKDFDKNLISIEASLERYKSVTGIATDLKSPVDGFNEAVATATNLTGFGGGYTIANTAVTFTFNVAVNLNAGDIETALIASANSVIINRLNDVATKPTDPYPELVPASMP